VGHSTHQQIQRAAQESRTAARMQELMQGRDVLPRDEMNEASNPEGGHDRKSSPEIVLREDRVFAREQARHDESVSVSAVPVTAVRRNITQKRSKGKIKDDGEVHRCWLVDLGADLRVVSIPLNLWEKWQIVNVRNGVQQAQGLSLSQKEQTKIFYLDTPIRQTFLQRGLVMHGLLRLLKDLLLMWNNMYMKRNTDRSRQIRSLSETDQEYDAEDRTS
jgi:hypothetical protein